MKKESFDLLKKLKNAKIINYDESSIVERTGGEKIIEISDEDVKIIDLSHVKKIVSMEGDKEYKPPKIIKTKKRHLDPWGDYKRNFPDYKLFCTKCSSTGICPTCRGKGRVKIIFKCPTCGGSGKCPFCEEEYNILCPGCGKEISRFADSCYYCGRTSFCPVCHSPLPFTATRCPNCNTDFLCPSCKKPVAPGIHDKCPYCGSKLNFEQKIKISSLDS